MPSKKPGELMIQRAAAIALTIGLAASLAIAEPKPQRNRLDGVVDAMLRVRTLGQVAISPDGSRVAWVEQSAEPVATSTISIADLASRRPRRLTASRAAAIERSVTWSRDGRQIAFLSDEASGQAQIWIAAVSPAGDPGRPRRLTSVRGELDSLSFSPDDQTIAFLFIENAPRAAGPLVPMSVPDGVIGSKIFEQRLATIPAAGGEVRQISPADMYVYEYDWSPAGRSFAAVAARGEGDSQWWVAQLHTIDRATGSMKSIYAPRLQIALPRFSPDGREIALIEGLMSDQGVTGGEVRIVPAGGGEARNRTPGLHGSVGWIEWLPNQSILLAENVDGVATVATLAPDSSQPQVRWSGAEEITRSHGLGFSTTPDGSRSAVIRSSPQHAPEVWAGALGSWKQITSLNTETAPAWGEMRNVVWTNDGLRVQGWLLYPRNYDPARRHPMVVQVHGGPASAALASWPVLQAAALASSGYFVFMPNPRGSFGQGEAFTLANVKDFGYGDLRDILAGVREVEKIAPIDPRRVGIWGWSYGGYMTMWAVTQTDAFRAAVAGAGLANWLSYYGENDIDEWMIPYFGASVYDDPYIYARSAPITFIKNAKTPTLVLVGDRDGECPAPQSFEFWHALRTLGVKTQLVVYPNEGHRISSPEHRRDLVRRLVAWFDENM
jgi:dipeptidyl aminopeptidase/acylaminoacyl peptidase